MEDEKLLELAERKLAQIRKLALSCEGYSYDLIVALADEAVAALRAQARHDGTSPTGKA